MADGSAPWAIDADGLIVMFRLTPRGGSDAIDGVETRADGRAVVKARVRAVPSGGAANDALIALLAKALRIAPGRMSIVAGESARIKRVKMRSGRLWRGREMSARRIDGKAIAAELGFKIAGAVARLTREHGPQPGLAVVLVGDNPASEIYVRSKTARTAAAGMRSFLHKLPATVAENELLAIIKELNADPAVHGILVQLPLPPQIDPHKVIAAIAPAKDVDGFHPLTAGRLATGLPGIKPCTPLACILLAKSVHPSLAGMEGVIIGRSNIVGKPLAHLLLAENATVTIAHSKTRDLAAVARRAEMLFVAIGRPEFVKRNFIKPGATVIDVGINRVATEDGKPRLVGDVAFAEASEVAGAITPVPGGVGPMTIACLMLNTLRAACVAADLPEPAL